MTLANFIKEVWSAEIQHQMEKALVFGALCNRQYEGDIANGGDKVRILEIGRATARAYTGASITWDEVQDLSQTLNIDQKYYTTQKVDDVDKVQSTPNLLTAASIEIAYALADKVDQSISALYSDAGTTLDYSATGIDSGNIIEVLTEARAYLSTVGNVPRGINVSLVVDPFTARAVHVAAINRGTPNNTAMSAGYITSMCGFDIYESNNIATTGTYSAGTLNAKLMAFTRGRSIALAMQKMPTVEAIRLEDYFADGLKSLELWGKKVYRPKEVVCINALINAETGV